MFVELSHGVDMNAFVRGMRMAQSWPDGNHVHAGELFPDETAFQSGMDRLIFRLFAGNLLEGVHADLEKLGVEVWHPAWIAGRLLDLCAGEAGNGDKLVADGL